MQITNITKQQYTIEWSVTDGDWIYMDTYVYSKEEYEALTPEVLLERQTKQYEDWRKYCADPYRVE